MKSKKTLIVVGIGVLLIAAAVIMIIRARAGGDVARSNITIVTTEQPHRETVKYQLKFTGDILPIQQANIYSKVGGSLERVYVQLGSSVREDEIMALIDTTELAQQFQQASATYQNSKLSYERTQELSAQNLVAKQDLDNADASMKVAKANYELAQTRLAFAHITAPFPGFVTKRYMDAGANIKANDVLLFTLMNLDEMKVMVDVLEKDIPLIAKGKKGVIAVDAFPGKEFYGLITRWSQSVDLSTRTMAVEIDIPNRDHVLKPGMYATITLIVNEHPNAITIPTASLVKDDRGNFVYIVNDTTAHRQELRLGIEQDNRTEVLAGLNGNEHVVTAGQQLLKDKAPVIVQQ